MKRSIRNRIGVSAALLLLVFVLISFGVSFGCVRMFGSRYQDTVAASALDFAELTINADKAKDSFVKRIRSDDYDTVQSKLNDYRQRHSDTVRRLSLVSFSNSAGSFIYDTGGAGLGTRLEYDDYTASIKAELINGRNELRNETDSILTVYRPLRTVDNALCGYLIAEMEPPFEIMYFRYIVIAFAALLGVSIVFAVLIAVFLDLTLFRPIRKITDAAVYLSGDDSVSEGKDASVMLRTKRTDEIGRLSTVLQKIFFDMNTNTEHLSQALYDANHDGMTQHLNKRCYHSMEETFRSCDPVCAVYFDVNNLKLMNDTLGHENGDYVIKQAADYIRGLMRDGDYCFRMGGDEFLLVMTARSFRAADQLLERLDREAPYILSREEDSVKCALSYGLAVGTGEHSYDDALIEAEELMYRKKAELKELLQMPER